MARPNTDFYKQNKDTYPYPSRFGSHESMIDATKQVGDLMVALQDENGFYVTERKNLDTGMADPYRYASAEYRAAVLNDFLKEDA